MTSLSPPRSRQLFRLPVGMHTEGFKFTHYYISDQRRRRRFTCPQRPSSCRGKQQVHTHTQRKHTRAKPHEHHVRSPYARHERHQHQHQLTTHVHVCSDVLTISFSQPADGCVMCWFPRALVHVCTRVPFSNTSGENRNWSSSSSSTTTRSQIRATVRKPHRCADPR